MASFTIPAGQSTGPRTLLVAETGTVEANAHLVSTNALAAISVRNADGAVVNNAGLVFNLSSGVAISFLANPTIVDPDLTIINTDSIASNESAAIVVTGDTDVVLDNAGIILAGTSTSVLFGLGDDTLIIRDGSYISGTINGSGGTDTLDYSAWSGSGVTAKLGLGSGTGFTTITGFENILGSAQGDALTVRPPPT